MLRECAAWRWLGLEVETYDIRGSHCGRAGGSGLSESEVVLCVCVWSQTFRKNLVPSRARLSDLHAMWCQFSAAAVNHVYSWQTNMTHNGMPYKELQQIHRIIQNTARAFKVFLHNYGKIWNPIQISVLTTTCKSVSSQLLSNYCQSQWAAPVPVDMAATVICSDSNVDSMCHSSAFTSWLLHSSPGLFSSFLSDSPARSAELCCKVFFRNIKKSSLSNDTHSITRNL